MRSTFEVRHITVDNIYISAGLLKVEYMEYIKLIQIFLVSIHVLVDSHFVNSSVGYNIALV